MLLANAPTTKHELALQSQQSIPKHINISIVFLSIQKYKAITAKMWNKMENLALKAKDIDKNKLGPIQDIKNIRKIKRDSLYLKIRFAK